MGKADYKPNFEGKKEKKKQNAIDKAENDSKLANNIILFAVFLNATVWMSETFVGEFKGTAKKFIVLFKTRGWKLVDTLQKALGIDSKADSYWDETTSFVMDVVRASMAIRRAGKEKEYRENLEKFVKNLEESTEA